MSEELTPQECRQLREFINAFAFPGVLNRAEYTQILLAFNSCTERMEKEGRVNHA